MKPFFSVIITVYNKEKYIGATLKSVLSQTFNDYEIIVVNDGSTDNSLDIIKSIKDDRITLLNERNQGASKARNIGIDDANADYIALLDGDDTWHKNYLQTVYNTILLYPTEHVFAVAIALKYRDKVKPVDYKIDNNRDVQILNFFENSLKHQILTSSSLVFKKKIIKKTGGFDETIFSGQDIDLWIRIGFHYKIVFINKVLVYYTYDPMSLSNTTFDLKKKPKFNTYSKWEMSDKALKRYLDKNRYAMVIMSRLYEDKESYNFYKKQIDPDNLSLRQKLLIQCPNWLLNNLLDIKGILGEKLYYKPMKSRKS